MLTWTDHEVATCRPGFGGRPMLGDRLRMWRRKGLLLVGGVIQKAKPATRVAVAILPRRIALTPAGHPIAWAAPHIANLPHNDALVAETISALWVPPDRDLFVEDD